MAQATEAVGTEYQSAGGTEKRYLADPSDIPCTISWAALGIQFGAHFRLGQLKEVHEQRYCVSQKRQAQ